MTTVQWGLGLLLASVILSSCTGPFAEPPPKLATVRNATDERMWLSTDREDIWAYKVVEPRDSLGICVVTPVRIHVWLALPDDADNEAGLFSLDLGDGDFCSGRWVWDGERLMPKESP